VIPYGLKIRQAHSPALSLSALPVSLQFFVFQRIFTEVDNQGMKAAFKPAAEHGQVSLSGPNRRHAIPTIQLFLENSAADLPQKLESFLFALAWRQ
jgi:hypothetical protein